MAKNILNLFTEFTSNSNDFIHHLVLSFHDKKEELLFMVDRKYCISYLVLKKRRDVLPSKTYSSILFLFNVVNASTVAQIKSLGEKSLQKRIQEKHQFPKYQHLKCSLSRYRIIHRTMGVVYLQFGEFLFNSHVHVSAR